MGRAVGHQPVIPVDVDLAHTQQSNDWHDEETVKKFVRPNRWIAVRAPHSIGRARALAGVAVTLGHRDGVVSDGALPADRPMLVPRVEGQLGCVRHRFALHVGGDHRHPRHSRRQGKLGRGKAHPRPPPHPLSLSQVYDPDVRGPTLLSQSPDPRTFLG